MNGPNRKWLERMADAEDEAGSVSVGGMAADLGMPLRSIDNGASEVAAGLEPPGDSDEPPSGSCEYCGVDVWDNHELCDQCEWWLKQ